MDLFIELETLQLISAVNDRRRVSSVEAKRGDALPLNIRFVQDGALVRMPSTTVINFAVKEDGKYDEDPLVLQEGFTASAVGDPDLDPKYTATPSLNTAGLNALFLIDDNSANDPIFFNLMAEISWEATGDTGPTTIKNFVFKVHNDVFRGDETAPSTLPTPYDWLDAANLARGIQPIRTAAATLFPTTLSVIGDIPDDDGHPITLSDLANLNVTGDQVEGTPDWDVTLPDGGTLTLARDGGSWLLTYSGPATDSDITLNSADTDKADPSGLSFTDGAITVTIQRGDGGEPPELGLLGYTSGTGLYQIWNGVSWQGVNRGSIETTGNQVASGAKTFSGLLRASGQNGTAATGDELINRTSGDQRYIQVSAPSATVPDYANDTAADAALASGKFYTVTGDRTLYVKP
jgi:hypothetical protein